MTSAKTGYGGSKNVPFPTAHEDERGDDSGERFRIVWILWMMMCLSKGMADLPFSGVGGFLSFLLERWEVTLLLCQVSICLYIR